MTRRFITVSWCPPPGVPPRAMQDPGQPSLQPVQSPVLGQRGHQNWREKRATIIELMSASAQHPVHNTETPLGSSGVHALCMHPPMHSNNPVNSPIPANHSLNPDPAQPASQLASFCRSD
ncbi:hypothetical protein GGTG_04778 [Gaeumannomyces tritici R3-111a-1]|uniref:Uncharacterized protein n=1 Tax=Gaeumannomyces tritici (strain R3-111a-1) TaxID=644352 RepID=J3NU27_GAET3|nr:hypothetical protein GGTG_04778 [Gaeumannomyces tritici R3-111a-1]EJT79694.1 hypothetical protein GGTG_04778 [Gaeumannomyces tritici R3-111a-1]